MPASSIPGRAPISYAMPVNRNKTNPIYPVVIEEKTTAHKQTCIICEADLEKGDLRVKIKMEIGYRRTKTYYYHVHCFLDKFIATLRRNGYDVQQYVAGRLFVS